MASTKDALQHCYDNLIAKIEDFLDDVSGLEGPAAVVARTSTWLENLLAALDSWGVDIRISNGSLALIENAPEGLKVRSILLEIDHDLSSPSQIAACFLPGQHSHESARKEPDLRETTKVRSILRALADLLDLGVLKSRIDEISAEHQSSSSQLLDGARQIGTDSAEAFGATNPIDDQPKTEAEEVSQHMGGRGNPGASLPSFRSYGAPTVRVTSVTSKSRKTFRAAEVQKQISEDYDGKEENIGDPHQKDKVERANHIYRQLSRRSVRVGDDSEADSNKIRVGNLETSGADNGPQKEGPIVPPSPYLNDRVQELIHTWSEKATYRKAIFAKFGEIFEMDDYLFLLEAVRCESSSPLQYRQACIRIYLLVRQYNTLPEYQRPRFVNDLWQKDQENMDGGKTTELEVCIGRMGRGEVQFGDNWSEPEIAPPLHSALLSEDQRGWISTPPLRPKTIRDPLLQSEVIGKPGLGMGFRTKPSNFFTIGRVFTMLWHENDTRAMKSSSERNTFIGEPIFSELRRFAVVRECHGFSWAVPVHSYSGQGLCRPGFRKEDWEAHAIIHMDETRPTPLLGEPDMPKRPIAVQKASDGKTLHKASRIRFDKVFTIEHNVKVQNIGKVTASSMPWFARYWREEVRSSEHQASSLINTA